MVPTINFTKPRTSIISGPSRVAQNCLPNIAKKDQSRARQNNYTAAERNFTKLGAHNLVVLCIFLGFKRHFKRVSKI